MAATLLPTVSAWPGSRWSAFHLGLALTTATGALPALLAFGNLAHPTALAVNAVACWVGLFLYERAYVRAGQLPPLS